MHISARAFQRVFICKFGFDTAENEPCKVCPLFAYRSPRLQPFVESTQPLKKVLSDDSLVTGAVIEMFDSLLEKDPCDLTKVRSASDEHRLDPKRLELAKSILHDSSPYAKMLHLPFVERLQKAMEAFESQEGQRSQPQCSTYRDWRCL